MMKIIRIVIALAVIAGTAYWAYDSVREQTVSGSEIVLVANNGNVVTISHNADESVPLEMTARANFGYNTTNPDLGGSPTREGTGRDAVYKHVVELPSGSSDFRITRGSNITFAVSAGESVDAVLTPLSPDAARTTIIVAGMVILAALYFISGTLEHRWLKTLRQKLTSRGTAASPASSASEARN